MKYKSNKILVPAMFSLFATGCAAMTTNGLNGTKVSVCVVDDEGLPINEVHTEIFEFHDFNSPFGFTDNNGLYSGYIKNIYSAIGGVFEKEGYYKTIGSFWRWKEWEKVPPSSTNFTIVMKRIINPVPIKTKEVSLFFPQFETPFGFDYEIGDWIFPNGKGKVEDMRLTLSGRYSSKSDYDMTMLVAFPDGHDGMQPFFVPPEDGSGLLHSKLPPPQIAPDSGYARTLERFTRLQPPNRRGYSSYDATKRWIFRTRTAVDDKGDIIAANYGWTTTDMIFAPGKGVGNIRFTYYYNPDPHSRSLEPKEIADQQAKEFAETMRRLDDAKK
jgi:hypothetical protein